MSAPIYDYKNQAWIIGGLYQRCNHPAEMECQCYGRLHAGEQAEPPRCHNCGREVMPGTYHVPLPIGWCRLEMVGQPV